MPKVIVYVPAAAWKKLEERGLDPAKAVREFAKRGYEMTGEVFPVRSAPGRDEPANGDAKPLAPPPHSDAHFKPDFK